METKQTMKKEKCLYHVIAESESKEAISFRKQFEERHPQFSFRKCMFHCLGYNVNCEDYRCRINYLGVIR